MLVLFCVLHACAPKSEKGQEDTVPVEIKSVPPVVRPTVDTVLTLSDVKLKLTAEYCLENYGVKTFVLDTPQMIVVHYTAIPDLKTTISLFKRNYVSSDREFIKQFSTLNVGIHYVIDRMGKFTICYLTAWSHDILSASIMCRLELKMWRPIRVS